MAEMIRTRATHRISRSHLKAWLAEHGVDIDDAIEVVIRLDRRYPDGVSAWLDVTWALRNTDGKRYHGETEDAATGTATIPLRSWPPLTAADGDAQQA